MPPNVRRYMQLAQSRGGACFCTRGAMQGYDVICLFSRWQKPRHQEGVPGGSRGRTAGHLMILFSQKVLAVRKANCIYRPVMGWFYLFCSIRIAFTASWSSLYHEPVAASTITGTSPMTTSNITQPAPTFVFTILVTNSYPSFLYSIV